MHKFIEYARDIADRTRGILSGEPELPPARLRDVGPGDFGKIGMEFLRYFVDIGSLQPSDNVLEIGCGPGRMALPLTKYLKEEGRYAGVDILPGAISWCQRHITRSYPNFSFHHVNVVNQRYRPNGLIAAREFEFPFPSRSFDLVLVVSVFTHMFPEDIQQYLCEVERLLRPTGRLFATFFLLNPVQRRLEAEGQNEIDFCFDRDLFRTRDERIPESAIAIDELRVRTMLSDACLEPIEPIRFGKWSGREDGLSFQDILLAKVASPKSTLLR